MGAPRAAGPMLGAGWPPAFPSWSGSGGRSPSAQRATLRPDPHPLVCARWATLTPTSWAKGPGLARSLRPGLVSGPARSRGYCSLAPSHCPAPGSPRELGAGDVSTGYCLRGPGSSGQDQQSGNDLTSPYASCFCGKERERNPGYLGAGDVVALCLGWGAGHKGRQDPAWGSPSSVASLTEG